MIIFRNGRRISKLSFVTGVGIVYSRRQDVAYAIGRGASLLLTAYLLNAARGYTPWSLGIQLGLLAQDTVPYGDVFQSLLEVDILHFAGLCFILLIGALRAAKVAWVVYPMVGVAFGHILRDSRDKHRL